VLASFVIVSVVLVATGEKSAAADAAPPWLVVVAGSAFWIPALICLRFISARDGTRHFRDDYTFRFRAIDVIGIPIGVLCQLVLIEVLYLPLQKLFPASFSKAHVEKPARDLIDQARGGWLVAIVLVVCVGAPIVEELFYRGLIFRALEGRLAAPLAIAISALWFGAAHLEWIQLLGLVAFGVVLAVCAHSTRRLGMGIFAHVAFNATSVALLLSKR
jgi:uncharacterized protein